jgi:hypothetical protein
MKTRSLLLACLALAISGPATAHDLMIDHEHTYCDTLAPFVWAELGPGQTWQSMVDLTQCSAEELGWFAFYGVIHQKNGTSLMTVGDNIVLSVYNMSTAETVTLDSGKASDPMRLLTLVDQPAQIRLYAQNVGRETAKIRLTWTGVVINGDGGGDTSTKKANPNRGGKKK